MGKKLSSNDKEILLLLDQHPKIGAKTLKKVRHHFSGNLSRILSEPKSRIERFFDPISLVAICEARKEKLDKKVLTDFEIKTLFTGDNEYPKLLLEIFDPPEILYCRGNLEILNMQGVAIVGSRSHTYYSKAVIEKIVPRLVESKIVIVSGLALGVDGLAHFLTLENGGQTIGVLGSGVEKIYPTSNQKLGDKMIEKGGAVISEFPPRTPPFKQNFPLRNRLIAGMTLGTLVVEARHESGSLITAGLANEYGREVFSVPGNIDSFASEGTNALIKEGAKLVTSVEDILSELGFSSSKAVENYLLPENENEEKIFSILATEPSSIDKIAKSANFDIIILNSIMSILEISGKVEKVDGVFRLRGKYKLK
ncbi:MAG: DNA processing protein [Candidatus Berkelbacteria bacterium Athens1014_28]|uniref:DNA processing protein n=1 Tax=Candidatus Berkelbacteria bacterium Athens1014_28 TaxID=2017145 RepID=A0A554LNW6_9BACT|nr:MAG: DNA processing protein [Candidatus Berkelbacteria bacterium Athens1014_28]